MKAYLSMNEAYPHFMRYMELYKEQGVYTLHEIYGAIQRIVVVYKKAYLSMNMAYTHFMRYMELYLE